MFNRKDQAPDAQPQRNGDPRGGEFQRCLNEGNTDHQAQPQRGSKDLAAAAHWAARSVHVGPKRSCLLHYARGPPVLRRDSTDHTSISKAAAAPAMQNTMMLGSCPKRPAAQPSKITGSALPR